MVRRMGVVMCLALVAALAALPPPASARQPVGPPEDLDAADAAMAEVNWAMHDAFAAGGPQAVEQVLGARGFEVVREARGALAGTSGQAAPASFGSSITQKWIRVYHNPDLGKYVAAAYWDWSDGAWEYFNGAVDTVSMHFVSEDGGRAKSIRWASGSGRITIRANQVVDWQPPCEQNAWVYKYDIPGGGIIFNFQDYTHWTGTYMCGDSGLVSAVFDLPPEPPFYAVFSYEHSWMRGRFQDANISLGSDRKLTLQVTYSGTVSKWKTEALQLYAR